MTDEAVKELLSDSNIRKIEDRDSQEVVGYFKVLDKISEAFREIDLTENNLKNLHNQLLKYSTKDAWPLLNVQYKLEKKLALTSQESTLSQKGKMVYSYIINNPGCRSGEIAEKLNIPKPPVKTSSQ